jgi:hypothetical protein
MGIDDESSNPGVVFRSCRRRYMPTSFGVRLFREPDAGNLPVRFDEREQETEPGQTGLRRARRKPRPIATGRLKPLRLFSTLLIEAEKAKEKRTLALTPVFVNVPTTHADFAIQTPRLQRLVLMPPT